MPLLAFALTGPSRTLFLALVIGSAIAAPLAFAFWRLASATRPRLLRISFQDRDEFLYRITEMLRRLGFSRRDLSPSQFQFDRATQAITGLPPITLDIDKPNSARLSAVHTLMFRIAPQIPGAVEEPYTGPSHYADVAAGFARNLALLAAAGAVLFGLLYFTFRDRISSPVPAPTSHALDVEQTLNITAAEARAGKYVDVPIGATGQVMRVYVQPRTIDGTRLHFTGMGKAPPGGNGVYGDLDLIVHVQ
jgi:hypothetical protein